MAEGYKIAEGHLEVSADPRQALAELKAFLRQVDRQLDRAEDAAERSGRESGRRFSDGLTDGLSGAGGGFVIDQILGPLGGSGGGEGGGGGGGFVQSIVNGFSSGFRQVVEEIRSLIEEIQEMLAGLGGDDFLSDLREGLQDLINGIRDRFLSVMTWLHGAWIRLFGAISSLGVGPFFSGLWAQARAYWIRFAAWASSAFSAMWTRIRAWWGSMTSALTVFWTRFAAWSVTTFGFLTALGRAFWTRFRTWGATTFTTLALVAGLLFSRIRAWAAGAFTAMRGWFSRIWSAASSRARSLWTRFAGWARSAFTAISGWFQSLWSSLSSGAQAVFSQLQSALSSLSSVAGQAGPLLQAGLYASLIPVILGLGGAIGQLLPLLFLLPAAIGVLAAAIAPLIVGFKGLGEAIGAGLSGDMEKFNEALKKLTPSARAFAKEFVKLNPILKEIKRRTQEALFKPLVGTIKPLATTLFPALAVGMERVAGALGRMLAGFARMLGTPEVVSAINALFATTARIIDKLGPPLASLFGALFGTMEGGLPWIERFVDVIATGIQKFADWLRLVKGDGSMQRWLETAWNTARDFWNVLVQVGEIVKNIFGDTGDEGQTFLQNLAADLERLNQWLSSDNGKEFLDDVVDAIVVVTIAIDYLVWIIGVLGDTWLIVKESAQAAWGAIVTAWNWITRAAAATWGWITNIASISWDWITMAATAVGDFFVMIGEGFVTAYNTVLEWGGAILDWFAQVPGWIGEFFSNLPGWIATGLAALRDGISYAMGYIAGLIVRTFLDAPAAIADAWNWIVSAVSTGASAVWNFITSWASNIWNSFLKLGSDMGSAIDSAWDSVYESTVSGVQKTWAQIQTLPGKAGDALSALPRVVSNWVSSTWSRAVSGTDQGVNNVTSSVRSLFGKVTGALSGIGSWLWSAGADMIRGLVNGISNTLGWAVDQARSAAKKIAQGFMDAIEVRSPSQLMRREAGRYILPGVMQGVDDTIPATQRHLGAVANMMVDGFRPTVNVAAPNVHTGDVMLQADFGEGIRQVVPIVISRNPRAVAGAAAVGKRERTGWVNTGRSD